ncbi:hypothetical protein K7432_015192 [Basidiobolus ranarum]|uniref:Uncharacterized protein n=1 Tax=Basidiobolus ranarum TaxID=34480 RepID=A0ABR2WGF3_9FUNG
MSGANPPPLGEIWICIFRDMAQYPPSKRVYRKHHKCIYGPLHLNQETLETRVYWWSKGVCHWGRFAISDRPNNRRRAKIFDPDCWNQCLDWVVVTSVLENISETILTSIDIVVVANLKKAPPHGFIR